MKEEKPDKCQGHVDSVQRHPVNFTLPTLPIPVGVAVAKRAHIHVVTVFSANLPLKITRDNNLLFPSGRNGGKGRGNVQVVSSAILAPTQRALAIILHIPILKDNIQTLHVQAVGQRSTARSLNLNVVYLRGFLNSEELAMRSFLLHNAESELIYILLQTQRR